MTARSGKEASHISDTATQENDARRNPSSMTRGRAKKMMLQKKTRILPPTNEDYRTMLATPSANIQPGPYVYSKRIQRLAPKDSKDNWPKWWVCMYQGCDCKDDEPTRKSAGKYITAYCSVSVHCACLRNQRRAPCHKHNNAPPATTRKPTKNTYHAPSNEEAKRTRKRTHMHTAWRQGPPAVQKSKNTHTIAYHCPKQRL